MRPMYETSKDLRFEREVLLCFCNHMGWSYKKIRMLDGHTPDASFWANGKRVAVGEVKVRTCKKLDYPTYMISQSKVDSILERWTPLTMYLIVRWHDTAANWIKIDDDMIKKLPRVTGGRKDRMDDQDIEICYLIPIRLFKECSE